MYGQTTASKMPQMPAPEQAGGLSGQPAPAGPLRTVAMTADIVARRANELATLARETEAALVGGRPQKDAETLGRAVPPRETFSDQVGGALDDTLTALNVIEQTLIRVREAL